MRKRGWLAILVVGAVLAVAQVVVPDPLIDPVYIGTSIASAGLLAVAVVRRPLARRGAWIALGLAMVAAITGDLIWIWYTNRGIEPFPSVADVAYLSAYPLYALGLWSLGRRGRGTNRAVLVDSCILGIAGLVLGWAYLLEPTIVDSSLTWLERAVSVAYPLGDLLILPLIARLVFVHGGRIVSHLFVLLAMVALLMADVAFTIGVNVGWYGEGGVVDSLFLAAYLLIPVAAWHPSAVHDPPALGEVGNASRRRLLALAFATLLAPLVLLVHEPPRTSVGWVAGIASILLFLLVVGRMGMLVEQVNEQSHLLESLSRTDPLTGAANRRALDEELDAALSRVARNGATLAFALLDLDRFKEFNDANGHLAGDTLLRDAVTAWEAQLRSVDLLARYGGEEFAVVLPDADADEALAAVERLRAVTPGDQTCSAGVAVLRPGWGRDELLHAADTALYAAKADGRDRAVVADRETCR